MRIGISGAQSVGKTTLLNSLRSEEVFSSFKFCIEVTRRVNSYGLLINENGNDTTQRLIMQEHIVNMFMNDKMITDRTSLDGLVYTQYLAENKKVTPSAYDHAFKVFKKLQPKYDIQFYIKPEFEIENDGVRSIDTFFRDRVVRIFEETIKEHDINVVYITGSVRDRVQQVIDAYNKKINEYKTEMEIGCDY
jgi:nicotinamide riboside kinase